MKLQDLVKIMKPAFFLVIKIKGTKKYLFDGIVEELTPDWLDKQVIALNPGPYGDSVEAVVA